MRRWRTILKIRGTKDVYYSTDPLFKLVSGSQGDFNRISITDAL